MRSKLLLVVALVGLTATACGSSRQSGICAEMPSQAKVDVSQFESQADAAWEKRDDIDQLRAAIAAWEKAVDADPSRADLRVKLSRAHYFLADGHLWFKREIDDDEKAKAEILAHHKAGTNQAEMALGSKYPGFRSKYCARQPFEEALQQLDKDSVPAMYWYATNLGRYALQKSLVEVLNQKDRIKAMMDLAVKLDPGYFYHAPDRYFGAYFTKIPFPSGDLAKSKAYFEKSAAASPDYLATKVVYATMNAAKAGDRALYEKLLKEVLAFDLNTDPAVRPENASEQRKAKYLLEEIDEYVEEE